MIDLPATRNAIADLIAGTVPSGVVIYADGAIDQTPALPAVVIGNPSWDPRRGPSMCVEQWSWPVAVIVARDGTSDPAANRQLEGLWPVIAGGLDGIRHLPGITGHVDNARFGPFIVGGITYPAYLITLTIYG